MDKDNYKRGVEYRHAVATFMKLSGLPVEIPAHRKASASALDALPPTHVSGIPDTVILTRSNVRNTPSEAVQAAVNAAEDTNVAHSVVVLNRPDRGVEESYVICTLADYVEVLRERLGLED